MKNPVLFALLTFGALSSPGALAHDYPTPPNGEYDSLIDWCHDSVRALRDAREQASEALSYGDHARANNALIRGLEKASDRQTGARRPLMGRAIRRGLQLVRELDWAMQGTPNQLRTMTHFLYGYYDFAIYVGESVDLPVFIPYHHHCGECEGPVDESRFENALVEYAKEQVRVVLNTLAEVSEGFVSTLGEPKAYLKGLELVLGYAESDLRESLRSTRFACVIEEIRSLKNRLACFNKGDLSFYPNEPMAVQRSYYEATDLMASITTEGCVERHYPRYHTRY